MKRLGLTMVSLGGMVFFILALLLTTGFCKDPIRIGVIRDLTGAAAELGRPQADAHKLVFDEINEKGGILGHKIEYMIGDEQASPDRAVSLAKRYVNVDKVIMISGTSSSAAGLGLMKYAAEEEVPVMGHAYSHQLHEGNLGKWYFAQGGNEIEFGKSWLYLVSRDKYKKTGVLWANYLWGRNIKNLCYERAKDYGLTIVGDVPIELGASEATAEASKLKAFNPEAIVGPLLVKEMAASARAYAALNWKPAMYGMGQAMYAAIKIVGPELMEGWRSPMIADPNDPKVLAVVAKFKARYGSEPVEPGYFIEQWDALNVLVQVFKTMIEKGEPLTRKNLRDAMEKYSGGVDLVSPFPRKSRAWGNPPHILAKAEDFLPMRINKSGKFEKY